MQQLPRTPCTPHRPSALLVTLLRCAPRASLEFLASRARCCSYLSSRDVRWSSIPSFLCWMHVYRMHTCDCGRQCRGAPPSYSRVRLASRAFKSQLIYSGLPCGHACNHMDYFVACADAPPQRGCMSEPKVFYGRGVRAGWGSVGTTDLLWRRACLHSLRFHHMQHGFSWRSRFVRLTLSSHFTSSACVRVPVRVSITGLHALNNHVFRRCPLPPLPPLPPPLYSRVATVARSADGDWPAVWPAFATVCDTHGTRGRLCSVETTCCTSRAAGG